MKSLVKLTITVKTDNGHGNASGVRTTLEQLAAIPDLPLQAVQIAFVCEYEDWVGWSEVITAAVQERPIGIVVTLKPAFSELIPIRQATPMDYLFADGEQPQEGQRS